jgi:hypothetical protein
MSNDAALKHMLDEAVSRARTRADAARLRLDADLMPPATGDDIGSLERRLGLQLPVQLRGLLSLHDGIIVGTFDDADPMRRRVLRIYSCAEIVEETEYLAQAGYFSGGRCAVGGWDSAGDRFVAIASDRHGDVPGGVFFTSPDDPSSFEGTPDYPDIKSWVTSVLGDL